MQLPATSVIEDGRESVVFVQPNGAEAGFHRTHVQVASRFRDVICIRAGGDLKSGDRVVTAGALLLHDAMEELPSPE